MIQRAIRLEWLTIVWTSIAACAGIIAGVEARSVSLTGFGLDSGVECLCAAIVMRRLRFEERHREAFDPRHERDAARIVGALLLAAAVYVAIYAAIRLAAHRGQEPSLPGLILAVLTIPIMVPLAATKLRLAADLRSIALRADAIGNAVCWYLAVVVVAALVAQSTLHVWWFDGVASLAIVAILVREGLLAMLTDSVPR